MSGSNTQDEHDALQRGPVIEARTTGAPALGWRARRY